MQSDSSSFIYVEEREEKNKTPPIHVATIDINEYLCSELSTNKMIFSLITRIGMHGAKVGLWTPILVIKLKIILFVDISACVKALPTIVLIKELYTSVKIHVTRNGVQALTQVHPYESCNHSFLLPIPLSHTRTAFSAG